MNPQKKKLEITGKLLRPLTIGDAAFISSADGMRRTSPVLSMEQISPKEVCFETLNTNYRLHLNGQEVVV